MDRPSTGIDALDEVLGGGLSGLLEVLHVTLGQPR